MTTRPPLTHVTHLGAALYEIAHADGWDSLDEAEGLEPTAGAVCVVRQEQLLTGAPEDWPDELFAVDGEPLFRQSDVYRGR